MRKIIDGKRYDTDSAELVFSWNNEKYHTDFRYRSKSLYVTKSGNFFVKHCGGAMTNMAIICGNSYCGSSAIDPISADDAFAFLCSHGGAEEAEKYFPDRVKDA